MAKAIIEAETSKNDIGYHAMKTLVSKALPCMYLPENDTSESSDDLSGGTADDVAGSSNKKVRLS